MNRPPENNKPAHGGLRTNAGRKSKSGQKTVVKRVPESLLPTIDALIADLDTRLPDGIRWLAPTLTSAQIPYSTDKIPAGFPSPAEPYVSDYIDFNEYLVQNQAATFTARSGGLSMFDAEIDKDDLLLIDRSKNPRHGDIVMADLGNEFTIKRLHITPGQPAELHSENAAGDYPNFKPKEDDSWAIVGVVTFVIKDFRRK